MTKVCHLTSVHRRYDVRIFLKECKSLSKAGHEVSLIVADGKGNESVDGISILDVGVEKGRILRFARTGKKIKKLALKLNCEIYHFHDPELIFLGLFLKKRGKKVIYDMHENVVTDILDKSYIPKLLRPVISFLYASVEAYSVKRFDGIVNAGFESIEKRLRKYQSRIEMITNYPILDEIDKKERQGTRIICYAGLVVPDMQHKEIIKAVEQIDNVKFVIAGLASNRYLKELQRLSGWNKVEYMGLIPHEEVKELYRKSSIGVAIYHYCKRFDGNYGSWSIIKLFEFMHWQIPVICTDYVIWKGIIEEEECGIYVKPYDVNAIKEAIQFLLNNPDKAKQMGINGREAVIKKYNWKTQEEKLLSLYERIK